MEVQTKLTISIVDDLYCPLQSIRILVTTMDASNQHGSIGRKSTPKSSKKYDGNRSFKDVLSGAKTHIYAFDKYDRRYVLDDDSGRFVFDTYSVKSDGPIPEVGKLRGVSTSRTLERDDKGTFVFTSKQRKKEAHSQRRARMVSPRMLVKGRDIRKTSLRNKINANGVVPQGYTPEDFPRLDVHVANSFSGRVGLTRNANDAKLKARTSKAPLAESATLEARLERPMAGTNNSVEISSYTMLAPIIR